MTEIEYMTNAYDREEVKNILHPLVREWFFKKFNDFSLTQLYSVKTINDRKNILVSAPTGGTKTLSAFLSILNYLIRLSLKNELEDKIYAVYLSPLRALSSDIFVNLITPLNEIKELAHKNGLNMQDIRVGLRTGDTTAAERAKMTARPSHILVTTSESLSILLNGIKFKEYLSSVEFCIIDEIHSFAENKRGVHLSLSLERLQRLSLGMARIGLSATVAPISEIAKFLVGYDGKKERNCIIANVSFNKELDLKVISPVKSLIDTTFETLNNETYALIDELIQQHKTTLIFTNTRAGTERVVHHLKTRFPKKYTENIGAHHGSLSKQHRLELEQALRDGKIKAVVCSTSLELGIDIGYIDLVILLGSPKAVARALQRTGRSGHRLHDTIKGRLIALDRDDLVEDSVLLKHALEHNIDKIHIPTNCLDVLAQHIYGIAIAEKISMKDLLTLVTNSYCYHTLDLKDFQDVIDYLAGKYISLEDRHIYAKIWHDEETGMIGKRGKLARILYMTNIGTIPDESFITVKIKEFVVGKIDEAFLEKLKRGDIFVLGGNTYQFLFARGMVAQVQAAAGKSPTVPSWFSDNLPLSFDLAMGIQRFRKLLNEKFEREESKESILKFIHEHLYVDSNSAEAIYTYFSEQYHYLEIPHEKKLLIEHYDEDKKKYVVFHALYGRRVNDVLSRAVAFAIAKLEHKDVEIGINDHGFYVAFDKRINIMNALKQIKSGNLRNIMNLALDQTEVLKRRFRHCATRALMILRTYKGQTKRVGRQQVSSMILMNAVKRISKDFPILKEARREVLEDLMDIDNAEKIFQWIEAGTIKIKEVHTTIPSPFAMNLVLQGKLDVLKADDKLQFLKRMHQLVMTKIKMKGIEVP